MTYWMYEINNPRKGDSGTMSQLITPVYNDEGNIVDTKIENNGRPQVGSAMRVGSMYARSYSAQDWWLTTPIEEIIEERDDYVKFKTRSGSIYEWKIL